MSVSNSVKSSAKSAVVSLIPVPYVKCVLVLAAVVKRLVEPSVTLSVLISACVTDRVPELCVIPVP